MWTQLPLLFTFPTISLRHDSFHPDGHLATCCSSSSVRCDMRITSLGSGSPLLGWPWPRWENSVSWNYLDTRGDDGLETIICRLKRPGEVKRWHAAQTLFQAARCPLLTSPIWPLSDPSSWLGGFHLQMKPQQVTATNLLTLESMWGTKCTCITEQDWLTGLTLQGQN